MLLTIEKLEKMAAAAQAKGGELIVCGDTRELVARFPRSPEDPQLVDYSSIEGQF